MQCYSSGGTNEKTGFILWMTILQSQTLHQVFSLESKESGALL